MANLKIASKITGGIIGFSMFLGNVGIFPTAYSATPYSNSEAPYQGLYDYVFEDVTIDRLELSPDVCKVTIVKSYPSTFGGFGANYVTARLDFDPLPEPVETEDGQFDMTAALREKNYSMLSNLREGYTATIRVSTDNYYSDLADDQVTGSKAYDFEEIVSVSSPDLNIYGDINADCVVDSFDVIAYRKQIAGNGDKLTNNQLLNGDINQNNKIDDDDLQQVQDFLLGISKGLNEAAPIGSIRLDNTIDVKASDGTAADEDFSLSELKFGVDLMKRCFDPAKEGNENLLISPLSISTALAMTANGADGKTRDEMEEVIGNGLTIDKINEYMAYYVKTLPDEEQEKIYLANSIWYKDKPNLKVLDEFLETNKKYYGSEIYKADFSDSTVKDVNSWVNSNTNGMIPSLLKKGDLEPDGDFEKVMLLINTLYFEAEWARKYTDTFDGIFTDLNGDEHRVKMMSNAEYEYFDLGDADAFKKPYINENYSFVGILPRDKDIITYVNDIDAEKLFDDLKECEDPSGYDLTVRMPKFQYSYDVSLSKVLEQMGMTTAFDYTKSNFKKMYDTSVPGAPAIYIDDVLHKTKIEVTESGTKAAAVTSVMMGGFGGMYAPKKQIIIELDRPFVYMIVDKNNIPLFIGAVTKLDA